MRKHYFLSRIFDDEDGYTIEALGPNERHITAVCEDSIEEANKAIKALLLDWLVELAEDKINPLEYMYSTDQWQEVHQSAEYFNNHILFSLSELAPILLRYRRTCKGWTQTNFAERLGVKQSVYAKLERPGKANFTLATIDRLAGALGDDLFIFA